MHLPAHLRQLCLLTSATVVLSATAQATNLVNDTFSDTDRNSGLAQNPVLITSTNTQWITDTATPLTPSATGLLWNSAAGTGSRYALGYFPQVTVAEGTTPTVFTLTFTTGDAGATANNLRIALLDTSPNGIVTSDGGAGNDAYIGDTGYGFFSSASTVGGASTTNLTLRTYQRNTLTTNNPLSAAGDWGNNAGSTQFGNSTGSTGYFEPGNSYTFTVSMLLTGSSLDITTSLTGGNFSGLSYTVTDSVSPTTSFDGLIFRLGGNGQYSTINFTSFTVSGVSAIPEPSAYATLAGLGAMGLILTRRRRSA